MMQELLVAVGIVLVLEGVLPFLSPAGFRRALLQLAKLDDGQLRFAGLSVMILGCVLLYAIRALR
jgi:uncharacterized protein YjeT (DUF2065 family)